MFNPDPARGVAQIALCAAWVLSAAFPAAAQEPDAVPVVTATAEAREMSPTRLVPGTIIGRNDSRVAAEVEGLLDFVAEVGDPVTAGQAVARIESTTFELALAEARAQLAPIEARLEFFKRESERLERLARTDLAARNQLDEMNSSYREHVGMLAAAKLRVEQAADRLRRTGIKAPFAGVVTERYKSLGERVEGGEQILRVVDTGSLEIQVRIPQEMTEFAGIGTRVAVNSGSETTAATVRARVPVGDDRSRLYELRLTFGNENWMAGQAVRVAIPLSEKRRIVAVPRDALVIRRESTSVFRIDGNGQAEAVAVETGVAEGAMIEVIGEISPGDTIVIRGNERLRSGQRVQIVERIL
ncbi:MAG: efflux RND transporter periplasmic adaptor subunit [Gammaproteobacteria bacterium]|nr:efflux RND transporter periplasmic adaptor subunit [Gammaproteobacteria bacterium]